MVSPRQRFAAALTGSIALLAAAGCTSAPSPGAAGPAPDAPSCDTTPVRTDRLPSGLDAGFSDPAAPPPWMGSDGFAAVLFYAGEGDPTMAAGGTMPDGRSTKILWMVRDADGPLTVRGAEKTTGGEFTQEIPPADQVGSYPSIVVVPAAGCWTLTAAVGGRAVGSITVPAV